MTLKKTITISIVFHICFFSAALLLSARLLEGSGKLPETEIVFIRLAADETQAVRRVAVPVKIPAVKKAEKPPAVLNVEQETALAGVAVEKAEAIREEVIPEEVVSAAKETVSDGLSAGDSPLSAEAVDYGKEIKIEHAVHEQPAFKGRALASAPVRQGKGLLPSTIELITMAIERAKTYPVIARKRGIEGTVHISFNVMMDGTPHGIKILKSSGFNILDRATVRVIKKAAPFPLVASRIELPVAYRLKN